MKKIYFSGLIVFSFLVLSITNIQAQTPSAPCFTFDSLYSTGITPVAITQGDFDGDNIPDVATVNSYNGDVSIFTGTGNGKFANPYINNSISLSGLTPSAIISGNFNGDQYADIAVAGYVSGSGTYAAYVY